MNKTNPNANAKAKRALRRKVQGALLATCLPIATLTACQTRKYNPNAKSLSEAYDAQSMDPASYFGLPGLVKGNNSNYVGFLIRTVPMLTHGSFEYAEKLARQIEEKTAKGWTVRPWGTERYTHVIYPTTSQAIGPFTKESWEQWQDEFLKAGSSKMVPPKRATLNKSGGVVLLTADDLTPERIRKIDDLGHQTNENIMVASYKPSSSQQSSEFKQTLAGTFFDSQKQEALSSKDPLWSIKFGRVPEAVAYLSEKNQGQPVQAGQGIKIGVIDTGFIPEHAEFASPRAHNVKATLGTNTLENDKDPIDKFKFDVQPPNPGHGSAVMAIISSEMPENAKNRLAYTAGLVPGAEVVPVRSTSSTVYKNAKAIAEAIDYLVSQKVQVISISLGGWPERSLQTALEKANQAGIIVVAAAGNGTPFVSAPAIYPTVLAVGAGTLECKAWDKSSPGIEVDVLAPGENVWYPASYKGSDGKMIWSLRRGSGTSFATPYVASLAALWIQANGGIENLQKVYSAGQNDLSAIPKAFELALKYYGLKLPKSHPAYDNEFKNPSSQYCTGFDNAKQGKTGAGFVDALNLVKAPLPALADLKAYKPNLSWQGEFILKNYAAVQHQLFYAFELDEKLENSSDPISQGIRKIFSSDPVQTKHFVINYLEEKYQGAAYESEQEPNFSKVAAQKNDDSSGVVEIIKETMKKCGDVAATALNLQCDIRWATLGANYRGFIEPADGVYFLKIFQYLEKYHKNKGKEFGNEQKKQVIEDLLYGYTDWIPEDL